MSAPESKAKQRARMAMLAGRMSECARMMSRVADQMHEVAARIEHAELAAHAKELHGASTTALSWVRGMKKDAGL